MPGATTIILEMDEPSVETKHAILRMLFPDLRYGGDPDIERYFELRREGRMSEALGVYNRALRVRYADDSSRVVLLKLYRQHSPQYQAYQDKLVLDFASRLVVRIRANIDLIVAPLERADLSDALHALKAVESVLARFRGNTAGAIELLSRYERFAGALGYRQALVARAHTLVREYDAVSRADDSSEYDFVARSAAIEERRRASAGPSGYSYKDDNYDFVAKSAELEERRKSAKGRDSNFFDASRIKFSAADKAGIEISPEIARKEDKVLAFCAKYWPRAADPAFERMVFLYSTKFGGKHYEVYRAIKIGRARKSTDDEILSAVSAILSTSYSYSLSGDLYMQVMWRRMRAKQAERELEARLAVPGPEAKFRSTKAKEKAKAKEPVERVAPEERSRPGAPAGGGIDLRSRFKTPAKESAIGLRVASRAPSPPEQRAPAPRLEASHSMPAPLAPASLAPAREAPAPRDPPSPPPSAPATMLRPAERAKGARLLGKAPSGPEPVREIRARHGSISDTIRTLSGRGYDVYKEIFLEKVRGHIRRALVNSQTRGHGIFDTATNEAEDQVYGFISAHYDDHFMDWEHSAEREAVEALGFSMPSLGPIIESCFKKL
jgi:hypothetical protein